LQGALIFQGIKCDTQLVSSNAVDSSSSTDAVIDFCCNVHSSNLKCFSLGQTTPKTAPSRLPLGRSGPPSNTLFLGPAVSPSNGTSIGSALFCRADKCNQQTHRQTDRQTMLLCLLQQASSTYCCDAA